MADSSARHAAKYARTRARKARSRAGAVGVVTRRSATERAAESCVGVRVMGVGVEVTEGGEGDETEEKSSVVDGEMPSVANG